MVGVQINALLILLVLLCGQSLLAQNAVQRFSTQGFWQPAGPPFSPEVRPDNSVAFRLKAPSANNVQLLFGEWDTKPQTMVKDTAGTWSITIGPVKAGIYSYLFSVDGVRMADLANPVIKRGTELYGSIVEVHGGQPRFDQWQQVPHGSLQVIRYYSTPLKRMRSMVVYLPPGYDERPQIKYPLLCLRHGGGDNETSWTQESGRADVILDNLIARQKASAMILVMPYGLTDGSWAGGSSKEGMEALEQELLQDILPYMETHYRLLPGKNNRAIAGLSMGGGQAFVMGLRNLDRFAWIGQFSSGLLSDESFDINDRAPGVFSDAAKVNKQLKLLWTGCGTDDPRMPGHVKLSEKLTRQGIRFTQFDVPGGHEWRVWRDELHAFLQQLFR